MKELNRYTDAQIIDALHSNLDQGFKMIVDMYTQQVYWNIRRLIVNFHDTEDVVQETFLKIYRSASSFRGDSSLKTWIYRISTNEALRYLEKQQHKHEQNGNEPSEWFTAQADEYINYDEEVSVKFQKAIHSLPPTQKAVFNLRYYDELDYDEIALALDISPASAKQNYHIAKEKIKAIITE